MKAFDKDGLVLYCSSFTKALAPDLRVGWTIPGRFKEKVKRVKFNSTVVNPQFNQEVIAGYLASGAYERHLRKMRNSLKKQAANMMMAVARYFPEGTRVSAPRGGICLWVELDRSVDSLELFELAGKEDIAIVPGNLCSVTDSFRHCIRLNYGYPWCERIEAGVKRLGELVHALIAGKG